MNSNPPTNHLWLAKLVRSDGKIAKHMLLAASIDDAQRLASEKAAELEATVKSLLYEGADQPVPAAQSN
jgi:hypothetical protein